MILVNELTPLFADRKTLELLLVGSHVDRVTTNLVEIILDVLGIQEEGIHRAEL